MRNTRPPTARRDAGLRRISKITRRVAASAVATAGALAIMAGRATLGLKTTTAPSDPSVAPTSQGPTLVPVDPVPLTPAPVAPQPTRQRAIVSSGAS